MPGTPRPEFVYTKQQRIAELARNCRDMSFTNLAHHIDMEWMLSAHARTRRDGAVGVDGQTADEYEVNLEANLQKLLDRAKSGTYVAPPVRRVHIPKAGSPTETRPLGIPICRSYCTSLQRRWGLIEGGPTQPWTLSRR
jgi:RNA-directed DNA polymerase